MFKVRAICTKLTNLTGNYTGMNGSGLYNKTVADDPYEYRLTLAVDNIGKRLLFKIIPTGNEEDPKGHIRQYVRSRNIQALAKPDIVTCMIVFINRWVAHLFF